MGNRRFLRASGFSFMSASPSASRRLLRTSLNFAIVGGLALAAWPLAQTLYAHYNQSQLEKEWQAQNARPSNKKPNARVATKPAVKIKSSDDPTMGQAAAPKAKQKWSLTKMSIPDINLETYAVQGWDEDALKRGPGHDPNSALPGAGNCVVAGHRNIYGSYFYKVDELMPGAPIVLQNRDGKFTYTTGRVFTTTDTDYSIMAQPAAGQTPILTLITCTMPHTSNRIVVQAVLSSVE